MSDRPAETVLVVDDEEDLADLYTIWLSEDYEVRTAYGGEQALAEMDDDVDVLLLDRRMPGVSGDEVLERVREDDRDYDVRVAMLTAVEPDFDIIEMPFDDYAVKPLDKTDVRETVDFLLALDEYDDKQSRLQSKRVRRNILRREKGSKELDESEEYQQLEAEIDRLESELDAITEDLDVGQETLDRRL